MKSKIVKHISEEARAWVQLYLLRKDQKTEQERQALQSLIDTLNETVKYISEVNENPSKKSQERESELSEIWSNTSIKVRPYKPALAEKCFFKGLYWADQDQFSEEEIRSLGITIFDMRKEVCVAIKSI